MLALFGPTATGKSALAHALALELGGEVVVADPFQRYRGLEVAADAPGREALDAVTHHFVGDLDLSADSTAGEFAGRAHGVIDELVRCNRVPIVAGGTGLYVRAATCDLAMRPPPPLAVRAWAEGLAQDPGLAIARLRSLDPEAAAAVDARNPRRLARALERAWVGEVPAGSGVWAAPHRRPTLLVGVDRPRDVLDRRIALRVRRELDDGLRPELEAACRRPDLARGPSQIIGLAEVRAIADGTLDAAALEDALCARTRRLARMQRTWLRRLPVDALFDLGDGPGDEAVAHIAAMWRRSRGGVG